MINNHGIRETMVARNIAGTTGSDMMIPMVVAAMKVTMAAMVMPQDIRVRLSRLLANSCLWKVSVGSISINVVMSMFSLDVC